MHTAVLALYVTYPITVEGNDDLRNLLRPRTVELHNTGNVHEEAELIARALADELGCHVQVWDIY